MTFALELTGVDLPSVDPEELRDLLARHGVVAARDQDLDDERFVDLLRRLGPLYFTTGEVPLPGFPDLNEVSNVGRTEPPKSNFHVDTSYVRTPPAYTALRAVAVPEAGGETVFADQHRAYDTLPGDVRQRLAGRTIRHVATGVELGPDDESEADHPVFRPHPRSGRTALYLSTPKRCRSISGLSAEESAATVARLLEHSTREDNLHRHRWRPGDVVLWDNGCVLHRADHTGVVGDRVLHRGMVAGG